MKYLLIILMLSLGCQQKPSETQTDQIGNEEKTVTPVSEHIKFDYDTSKWMEITDDKLIKLDIRYATKNNFTKQQIYSCPRCFLHKSSAKQLYSAIEDFNKMGYGVKLFDCYRPHPAQRRLWEIVPNPMYVADPEKGSMHNRGLAVDLTLIDQAGNELDLGTTYDFFGPRAYHDYFDLDADILAHRNTLKTTLAKHGFAHIRTEWWHYSDTTQFAEIAQFEWPCPN